ncbi:MAG: thermonuclease family protein [Nitrospirae bacterium]|nr:thermonuclease family protein [Nitrospirota bacterium]
MPQIRHPHQVYQLNRVVLLVLAFATLLPLPALARPFTFSGTVVSVHDGDTISVVRRNQVEKVRLAGIDCPELRQAFGPRAKQFTSRLASGQMVSVRVWDVDSYGRKVGDVTLPDGRSLNRELVAAGFAWRLTKSSKNKEFARLEGDARRAKRGLWADAHPKPPWEFRKAGKAGR